ncbi:unnamed protein product [Ectocarpus sp. 12 AP-2014]
MKPNMFLARSMYCYNTLALSQTYQSPKRVHSCTLNTYTRHMQSAVPATYFRSFACRPQRHAGASFGAKGLQKRPHDLQHFADKLKTPRPQPRITKQTPLGPEYSRIQ